MSFTARKVCKYGVFSGPYFPVFGLNTRKYRPEKSPYLDTFHAVICYYSPMGHHGISYGLLYPMYI